jgi:hypothetical protein
MRNGITIGAVFSVSLAMSIPLAAADVQGIAFAQAEEGTWWCRSTDGEEAARCALQQCASQSGGQDCYATRWCYPAGWSGLMITWLPEFHATTVLCGVAGEAAVRAGLQALCGATPEYTRCDLILLIDPDGNEQEVRGAAWPGPAITEAE